MAWWSIRLRVLAAVTAGLLPISLPAAAQPTARGHAAVERTAACKISASIPSLAPWLERTRSRLAQHDALTIVAIGSSSTYGAGASSTAASYPSRLEALLREQFPGISITVINRGVNGQEAAQMLARFDSDVIARKPDLVLWQVGTNAVLRAPTVSGEAPLIRTGIERLKSAGADVLLIDPQYAPRVLKKPEAHHMVELIGMEAREAGTGVFRRFALMRDWYQTQRLPFATFVTTDGLHLNDWGYDCVARNLAAAIAKSAARPTVAAEVSRPDGVKPEVTRQ
jgi:acyl-CoA thioesterase I